MLRKGFDGLIRTHSSVTSKPFDPATCSDYRTCSIEGTEYYNKLAATIGTPYANDPLPGSLTTFQQFYDAQLASYSPKWGAGVSQGLAAKGIDITKMFLWSTFPRDLNTGQIDVWAAYTNLFDTNNGAIVGIENWRSLDTADKLSWSEIIYQTWKIASAAQTTGSQTYAHGKWPAGGPIRNLKYVVQHQIAELTTINVLSTLYKAMRYPGQNSGDTTWRLWKDGDDTGNWFRALMGTDACKGTMWLLNDHAVELGKKEINEIWTRWSGEYPDV
ncbi:MAG: hypothetical protein Q9170_007900 [Blastenia crenularia]